jgi:hypothetical protein
MVSREMHSKCACVEAAVQDNNCSTHTTNYKTHKEHHIVLAKKKYIADESSAFDASPPGLVSSLGRWVFSK